MAHFQEKGSIQSSVHSHGIFEPLFQQVWSQMLRLGVDCIREGNLTLRVHSVPKPDLEDLYLGFKVKDNVAFSPLHPSAG